jgi:hypothetical protein
MQEDNAEAQEQIKHRGAALAAFQQLQQGSVSDAMAIALRFCPAVLEVGWCALLLLQATAPSQLSRILMLEQCIHKPQASSNQLMRADGPSCMPSAAAVEAQLHALCTWSKEQSRHCACSIYCKLAHLPPYSFRLLFAVLTSVAAGPASVLQAEASAVH